MASVGLPAGPAAGRHRSTGQPCNWRQVFIPSECYLQINMYKQIFFLSRCSACIEVIVRDQFSNLAIHVIENKRPQLGENVQKLMHLSNRMGTRVF